MRRLDRSRPFGSVTGTGCPYAYEQDGRCFKGDGTEYIDPSGPRPRPSDDEPKTAPPVEAGEDSEEAPGEEEDEQQAEPERLENLTMPVLRRRHFELFGKNVPVGITKPELIAIIQGAEAKRKAAG